MKEWMERCKLSLLKTARISKGALIRAISFFVCCETPGRGEKA
jgi:hypothetical protein